MLLLRFFFKISYFSFFFLFLYVSHFYPPLRILSQKEKKKKVAIRIAKKKLDEKVEAGLASHRFRCKPENEKKKKKNVPQDALLRIATRTKRHTNTDSHQLRCPKSKDLRNIHKRNLIGLIFRTSSTKSACLPRPEL